MSGLQGSWQNMRLRCFHSLACCLLLATATLPNGTYEPPYFGISYPIHSVVATMTTVAWEYAWLSDGYNSMRRMRRWSWDNGAQELLMNQA